eukprot:jgi/Mesen1/4951/ME000247S04228
MAEGKRDGTYYAEKGITYTESFIQNSRDMKLCTTSWVPFGAEPKAVICLCHGYGVDCSTYWPEVGEKLALGGYAVHGIDYEGHGLSDGLHAFLRDMNALVDDCVAHYTGIREKEEYRGKAKFLFGESMGGAVALLIHRKEPHAWHGAVLLAPMCKISKEMKPPGIVILVLKGLSLLVPSAKLVPSKDIYEIGFKDPAKRAAITANPKTYKGKPRLATALTLLRASEEVERTLAEVSLPLLLLHGDADIVTDPGITEELYHKAASSDKEFKRYDGMWHGLLEGEPDDNVALDIFEWLDARCTVHAGAGEAAAGVAASATPVQEGGAADGNGDDATKLPSAL